MAKKSNRLHWRGYASILRLLLDEPGSARDIAQRQGIFDNTARIILRRLLDLRLVHVHCWRREACRGMPVRVFGFGDQPDAPRPKTKGGTENQHAGLNTARAAPRPELTAFAHILRSISEEPRSLNEIAEETGTAVGNLGRLMRHMHALRLVHIAEWRRNPGGRTPARLFLLDPNRPDAKRPKPEDMHTRKMRHQRTKAAKKRQMRIQNALAGVTHRPQQVAA